ncbi:MAG: phosphatidate cytidylyltransferase [Bacteroidota bacterium]
MKEIIRRTATGISLVVPFTGSILLGPIPFLVMILVIYGLGTWELFRLLSIEKRVPAGLIAGAGALFITATVAALQYHMHPLWFTLPLSMWLVGSLWPGFGKAGRLVLLWLATPFAAYTALGWLPGGVTYLPLIPLSVIALVWINDIFAYLTGSLLGKHPITPRLSPGKTWEGFVGGIVFTLLAGWLLFRITGVNSAASWILSGGIISILGFAGDLFESGLKRKYHVKDMGNLLPGHGGILDRFDSLLFVTPALLLVLVILNLFL